MRDRSLGGLNGGTRQWLARCGAGLGVVALGAAAGRDAPSFGRGASFAVSFAIARAAGAGAAVDAGLATRRWVGDVLEAVDLCTVTTAGRTASACATRVDTRAACYANWRCSAVGGTCGSEAAARS